MINELVHINIKRLKLMIKMVILHTTAIIIFSYIT
jgi:hypothetical protein